MFNFFQSFQYPELFSWHGRSPSSRDEERAPTRGRGVKVDDPTTNEAAEAQTLLVALMRPRSLRLKPKAAPAPRMGRGPGTKLLVMLSNLVVPEDE